MSFHHCLKKIKVSAYIGKNKTLKHRFEPKYTQRDLHFIDNFILNLKLTQGNWSQNGLQRIVRLKSSCSQQYVSLREGHQITADATSEKSLREPHSKCELNRITKIYYISESTLNSGKFRLLLPFPCFYFFYFVFSFSFYGMRKI